MFEFLRFVKFDSLYKKRFYLFNTFLCSCQDTLEIPFKNGLSKLNNVTSIYQSADLKMTASTPSGSCVCLPRKEVIQPHLPIRLPCYDFTPIIAPPFAGWLLAVTLPASGVNDFRGVTGGVYKARERIHRSMLTCDY